MLDKNQPTLIRQEKCSVCRLGDLYPVHGFGAVPLANDFGGTARYPLTLMRCERCWHYQLEEFIDNATLFADYPYRAGTGSMQKALFRDLARSVDRFMGRPDHRLVVDVGCNDESLLEQFVDARQWCGIDICPIKPGPGIIDGKWEDVYSQVKDATVILFTNAFAHMENLHRAAGGVAAALDKDGVCVIQLPWVRDLLDRGLYDTIYHEHKHFFGVSTLDDLFTQHWMKVTHVEYRPEHGGSIRAFIQHANHQPDATVGFAKASETMAMGSPDNFSVLVEEHQEALQQAYFSLGERPLVALGASAKGIMLTAMNPWLPITKFYDDTVSKIGTTAPGGGPIVEDAKSLEDGADRDANVLITAWNYADKLRPRCGQRRVLVPMPFPQVY